MALFFCFRFCFWTFAAAFMVLLSNNITSPSVAPSGGIRCYLFIWAVALLALVLGLLLLLILLQRLLFLGGLRSLFWFGIWLYFVQFFREPSRDFGQEFWLLPWCRVLPLYVRRIFKGTDWILFSLESCCHAAIRWCWNPLEIIQFVFGLDIFLGYWFLRFIIGVDRGLDWIRRHDLRLWSMLCYFRHACDLHGLNPTPWALDRGWIWRLPPSTGTLVVFDSTDLLQYVDAVHLSLHHLSRSYCGITRRHLELLVFFGVWFDTLPVLESTFDFLRSWDLWVAASAECRTVIVVALDDFWFLEISLSSSIPRSASSHLIYVFTSFEHVLIHHTIGFIENQNMWTELSLLFEGFLQFKNFRSRLNSFLLRDFAFRPFSWGECGLFALVHEVCYCRRVERQLSLDSVLRPIRLDTMLLFKILLDVVQGLPVQLYSLTWSGCISVDSAQVMSLVPGPSYFFLVKSVCKLLLNFAQETSIFGLFRLRQEDILKHTFSWPISF